ncbi:hypothetical protein [Actinophytocola xanthii]|uniref:hypothetical protein n=1 Tax=Actinophytocola xanthii TaxID=1912961 RepID=UPI001178880F|nr:hypothetical protein [Actinophytocola xanthii]
MTTLTLPAGVTALPAGLNGFAAAPRLRLDGLGRQGASRSVGCPGGVGSVSCSAAGVAPGETVTLRFRVVAARSAVSGDIGARITAGPSITLGLRVPVTVAPPPVVDGVELTAQAQWHGLLTTLLGQPALLVHVENTGTSSRPVKVRVNQPGQLRDQEKPVTCLAGVATECTTRAELTPGESVELEIEFETGQRGLGCHRDEPGREVQVQATLGTAHDAVTVVFDSWFCPDPPSETPVPPKPPVETEPGLPVPPSAEPGSEPRPTPEPDSPPTAVVPTPTTPAPPTQHPPHRSEHGADPRHEEEGQRGPRQGEPPSGGPGSGEPRQEEPGQGGLGGLLGWLLGG